ncbi:DEAD/DEAH box helicase [Antarcticibacterium flavum]|uniref:DEAD-box ATP-dependent RNA helicase RhpA n=1 Tax=Antarcticibacterium flavum TaxID=2058175 RepID=A0A5B7X0M2_9FLAO|nr:MULTISPECIES: DEAD/DEAH box helicase [Antarcticibacterium]MCM4160733.1 DEAD/DEAH box helicase [Antarcticibacterium sp. W02-3]QCY68790.1 DEAD/DEAH box helicase [Antarcticibacterium flavum]
MTFTQLELTEPLQKAVQQAGYKNPTPIQSQSIPAILNGRDILGCAQTGTGKTAAFSIPTIQLLSRSARKNGQKPAVRSLILTPTRELAIQIGESLAQYGSFSPLKHLVIFGGVPQHSQVQALKHGVDILVATPGRLLDLMDQGYISLSQLEIFTLDEADRMLDMGFVHDVKKVIKKIPAKRQTLFFSATMPDAIVDLANSILNNPLKVEVTPVSSTAEMIGQEVYFIDKTNKKKLLIDILKNGDDDRILVFTRTKHGANKVVKDLTKVGIKAEAIHGNKTQNARQKALKNFKDKTTRVLVATDIAARGIDIDELALVINYEIPNIAETYVHRIGRTGRAGASGKAISFCDFEEKAYLKDIQKLIDQKIPEVQGHSYPMEFFEIPEKKPQQRRPARNAGRQGNGNSASGKAQANRRFGRAKNK